MFKRLLYKFGAWLVRKSGGAVFPVPSAALYASRRAANLIEWNDKKNLSGEGKRHQVYAQLLKDYPGVSKRDIAMAIELAMRGL